MAPEMRDVVDHQKLVASLIGQSEVTSVNLESAAGMALAGDYRAGVDLPAFDNSAMDGYAVRATDLAGATAVAPVVLPVSADIPAGCLDLLPLESGSAHRIMTGAPVPPGADTVVQIEATDGGTSAVAVYEERPVGTHVRSAGADVHDGEIVLPAGTALGPTQLALLTALGEKSITVHRPLSVLVLSTGSELVEVGQVLRTGQIYDANGVMLSSAIVAAGARPVRAKFVADDIEEFLATVDSHVQDVDLVLTSGGVSAGAYEVVKDALSPRGIAFTKVAMQPGMPQGAGTYGDTPIITLPGNPVSALVSFEVFVRPAIRAAMGFADTLRPVVRARLAEPLDSPLGKRQFRRGILDRRAGRVRVCGPAASHHLRWLATSNCLIDIDANTTMVAANEHVDVWDLS